MASMTRMHKLFQHQFIFLEPLQGQQWNKQDEAYVGCRNTLTKINPIPSVCPTCPACHWTVGHLVGESCPPSVWQYTTVRIFLDEHVASTYFEF